MDLISKIFLYGGLVFWLVSGMFLFYTSVRDDIRNERERKEEKKHGNC